MFTKQECIELAPQGYVYIDTDDRGYWFQSGDYQSGFKVMLCHDEDMTPENLALMAKMGLTRTFNKI